MAQKQHELLNQRDLDQDVSGARTGSRAETAALPGNRGSRVPSTSGGASRIRAVAIKLIAISQTAEERPY
jgi:aspartate 1-decarboxylase